MFDEGLIKEAAQSQLGGNPRAMTLTEVLEMKKERLEKELTSTNEALDALKANPEVERVLNLVQRVARI